jgi:hypothetical protein
MLYANMMSLTKKQLRTIDYAVNQLFGSKSFMAPALLKGQFGPDFLTRLLQLTNHRITLFTDTGLANMQKIVATIDEASMFNGLANYSDIWSACRSILENLLSQGKQLKDARELLESLRQVLDSEISNHTFVVPLFGIEMDGIESIPLGSMKVIRPSIAHLDSLGVKHDHADLKQIFDSAEYCLWLIGSERGTLDVSLGKFRTHAELRRVSR